MRTSFIRPIAVALTAATIATSLPLTSATAAPANSPALSKAAPVTSDFSARRRGNAAGAAVALGAFALIAGAAIAASRRDDCGPYGCGYAYAPQPYYGGYGYGRPYYRHHWHHWR